MVKVLAALSFAACSTMLRDLRHYIAGFCEKGGRFSSKSRAFALYNKIERNQVVEKRWILPPEFYIFENIVPTIQRGHEQIRYSLLEMIKS